jgi:ApbE superfamily uncharacterized protein (UPF0280 family)
MSRMQARMLPDGRRLHLSDGPIDLIVGADGDANEVQRALDVARIRCSTVLDELCTELPLLRQPAERLPEGAVARRMWRATIGFATETFITPMAAVAGAVAEEILYAMVTAASLDRAHVNNGGDIALHLGPWQSYRIGLVDRPDNPSLFSRAQIRWNDGVRGIATSGWRGRSLSFGIADSVTVLAANASAADAAATLIANAVDLPGHPVVTRVKAVDLQPDSDLGQRLVTRGVGPLNPDDIDLALSRGMELACAMTARQTIMACALHLAGQTRTVGEVPVELRRSLVIHA